MLVPLLLATAAYQHPLVFFLYCLSVSYRQRAQQSWTREETRRHPLAALLSIVAVNLGGRLLAVAVLQGRGVAPVLQDDARVGVVVLCWWVLLWVWCCGGHDGCLPDGGPFRVADWLDITKI